MCRSISICQRAARHFKSHPFLSARLTLKPCSVIQDEVLVKLSKWLLVLALSLSLGLHWEILQSVAWVGMVINYSQGASVSEGLAKTFDGKHPCCLCKLVDSAKKSENKQAVVLKIIKPDFCFLQSANPIFYTPFDFQISPADSFFPARLPAPPTPPPRSS